MSKVVRLLVVSALVLIGTAQPAFAGSTGHLSGGGTASISQVAFNVSIAPSGGASGSFECLMAGRSAFVLGSFGLSHIMAVHTTPTKGTVAGSVVTFSGPARLIMDNGVHRDVHVAVWANAATQQFQLTVLEVGTMPVETLLTGQIALR
jgi:hypothetical protein